tara:strand:- start:219 stop:1421 length:1203 start_codon:yes stop_codon:yes gene_type:complete
MPFENILDRLKGQQPGSTKSVRELNKTHMTPKAKATALKNIKAPSGTGLGLTVSQLIPQGVYDRIGQEIVRGGAVVLGGDTSLMDARISGRPLVKSVGSVDFNVATDEGMAAYKKALEQSKKTEERSTSEPPREKVEEIVPDRYKDIETRTNGNGIVQSGRNFNTMAESIFKTMAERNANTGVAASTLSAMNSMNPVSKYSSTNLPATDTNVFTNTEGSPDSFMNPGIAVNTGAVQPRDPDVNFSSAYATQFERPVDMPSVITKPGPKNPVEYTNYMTSDNALGSMDALRMNEKQKGLIYASGQYWGKGADGKAVKVDRNLARKVKLGAEGADELLANFLGRGGLSATGNSVVEAGTNYTAADYNSQGQLLNDRNLLTFKDGSTKYLSDIPEDEDLSATY